MSWPSINAGITIGASPPEVWRALTDPGIMKQWMAEPEMQLEIVTGWQVGGPIVMRGRHHVNFENKGFVLHFEPCSVLAYTHLSSISRLPDEPESYTTIEFHLAASDDSTLLTLRISNFPTESIYRHFEFYWRSTLHILKGRVEDA